jgi:hypothetical protein
MLWQIDFEPLSVIIVLGFLVALIGPSIFSNPSVIIYFLSALVIFGLACLIISKISLYKKGIWFSFGTALMTKSYANLYKIGYLLLCVGAFLLLALFYALRRT